MRRNVLASVTVVLVIVLTSGLTSAQRGPSGADSNSKKVLVELFTSQGCNMCPAAEALVARLPELGFERDRVIPLAFHVDYFDTPWKDPFSDRQFSAREWEYSTLYDKANKVGKKDYLYFTPMLMVDGRYPMLGSDQAKAQKAIAKALAARPGVLLDLDWEPGESDRKKLLEVTLTRPASELVGRETLVGVAIYEDPLTTQVASGENAGETLTEHFVVRKLDVQATKLQRAAPNALRFAVELAEGWNPERCGVVAYAQDAATGRVHQAESHAWQPTAPTQTARR